MQWADVLADATLRDLPFKVELNARGVVEMSPTSTWQGRQRTRVIQELTRCFPEGEILSRPAIQTVNGVRVPDVAWRSAAALSAHGYVSPLPVAPELCVEVLSDSNSDAEMAAKRAAYFASGAQEVWLVADDSSIVVYTKDGLQTSSTVVAEIPKLS